MVTVLVSLLTLFSPTQLGKHFWPAYSYLKGFRLDYLSPTFYFTDFILLALLPFNFKTLRQKLSSLSPLTLFTSFLLILANILLAAHPLPALIFWLRLLLLANLALLLLFRSSLFKPLYYFLLISLVFTSLLTFAQFLFQSSLDGLLYYLGERHFTAATPGIARLDLVTNFPYSLHPSSQLLLRPYATFSHPNSLAGFLLVSLLLQTLLSRRLNLKKTSLYLTYLLVLPALFLTFSRSVLLATFLLLPLLLLSSRLPNLFKKLFPYLILLLIFLFSLLFLFPSFSSHLSTQTAWQNRLLLNHASLRIFLRHPLFGTGLNNFLFSLSRLHPHLPLSLLQPAHHLLFLLLSQLGLLIFLPLIYVTLRLLLKLSFPAQLLLFALLLTGLTDHYWLTLPQNRLLLTFTLSFLLLPKRSSVV